MNRRLASIVLVVAMLLNLFTLSALAAAAPVFTVGDASVTEGEVFSVDVTLTENSSICGGSFNIVYDNTVLEVVGASVGDVIRAHTGTVKTDYAENKLRVTWAGITPITDGGTVCTIEFKAIGGGSTSELSIENASMYDYDAKKIAVSTKNGSVTIAEMASKPEVIIKCADVTAGDSVTASIDYRANGTAVCGGTFEVTYDSDMLEAVSVTAADALSSATYTANASYATNKVKITFASLSPIGDGKLCDITFRAKDYAGGSTQLVTTGFDFYNSDFEEVVVDSVGTALQIAELTSYDAPVLSVVSTYAANGENATVYVNASDSYGICGGSFELFYDSDLFEFVSAEPTSVLSGASMAVNHHDGNVKVSFACSEPLENDGRIIKIVLAPKSRLTAVSAISLYDTELYDADSVYIEHSANDGTVCVDDTVYMCDGFLYRRADSSSVEIVGFADIAELLVIPETLGGYSVTSIGEKAFADCGELISVTVPDTVSGIGADAFYNCNDWYICCNENSYAAEYAVANSVNVHYLDSEKHVMKDTLYATCLEGRIEYKCTECGYKYSVPADAAEHNYVKGALTPATRTRDAYYTYTCINGCNDSYTETAVGSGLAVTYSHSVVYASAYVLKFRVPITVATGVGASDCWMEITQHDLEKGNVVTVVEPMANGNVYEFESPGIAAKNMNDNITAVYYQIAGGIKYAAQVDEFNLISYYKVAKAYADKGAQSFVSVVPVLEATLNYGTAAQIFFGYNTVAEEGNPYAGYVNLHVADETARKSAFEDFADTTVTEVRKEHGDETGMDFVFTSNAGELKQQISLIATYTATRVYTAEELEGLEFRGTYTDVTGVEQTVVVPGTEFELQSSTKIKLVIDSIPVKDLRVMLTGAIYDGDTKISETCDTSFACYASAIVNNAVYPAKLKGLCKAVFAYSDAARDYFASMTH